MADQNKSVTSATVGVSFALFIVWMQRQGRWSMFLQALTGRWQIIGSRTGGSLASGSSSSSSSSSSTSSSFPSNPKNGQTFSQSGQDYIYSDGSWQNVSPNAIAGI